MADNFNLRSFLSENKLTKNAQLLREVSDYGFDDLMDAVDDLYAPGTPEHTELSRAVEEAIHNNEIDMSEFGDNPSAPSQAVERIAGEIGLDETTEDMYKEAYTPKSKLEQVIQQAWAEPDLEKAKQIVHDLIEPSKVKSKDTILQTIKGINSKPKLDQYLANSLLKFEKLGLNETATTMTTKETELVKMVQEALGMEGYGDDNVNLKRDKQGLPPQQGPTYSEGDGMADETVIPEYNTIEELMKQIDKGTNRVAEEHKVLEMKKIAKALRGEAQRMEESEHAKHINPKVRKKYLQDAIKIEKAAEKLVAALEKEAKNTKPAAAPKKEEAPVTLAEGTFDLRKFLAENRK